MYENVQFAKRYVNIKKKFKFVRILNNYACVNYIFKLDYFWGRDIFHPVRTVTSRFLPSSLLEIY